MTTTDSDRILAAGVPIELAGGEARLRFTFRTIKKLEDHFGSLSAAADRLDTAHASAWRDMSGPVLGDITVIIAAALDPPVEPDDVLDLLKVGDGGLRVAMQQATSACIDAWNEGFPAPSAEGKDDPPATEPTSSDGPTPTGSSPASLVAATSSSGG